MNSPTKNIQVTLKAAISLDGKIASAGGDSKWITGESSRLEGHRLRSQHDAILVGINTVLKDNPSLTTRGIPNGRSPMRIILDSKGRLPSDSKVLEDDGVQVIQVIGNEIDQETIKSDKNVEILRAPSAQPEPLWLLEQLEMKDMRSLLVEGGAKVHGSFIESGCVSSLHLFIAPKVIGGESALSWCGDLGTKLIADATDWEILSVQPLGQDFHLIAEPLESS
ncbi:MAG: bifunctional diaminohydroxyphosphoribosylaminopyrimidine deaminase/5-amino-6-(5-phosphoribosylamino)uracil reductase RibD [bacterium]